MSSWLIKTQHLTVPFEDFFSLRSTLSQFAYASIRVSESLLHHFIELIMSWCKKLLESVNKFFSRQQNIDVRILLKG